MPSIDWIGKAAVERHHLEVPYRLLHCNGKLSAGNPSDGNLLVQGDNLEALRTLLPYYAGRIKCIYIDPPYNTGNEGWVYNDSVNSPEMLGWLGQTVGSEAEDMCRHDKWLCMMYPRLRLLRDFLSDDGVIFVSIDDNEQHRLRMLMDEIFKTNNFVNSFCWANKLEGRQITRSGAAGTYETILAYAKDRENMGKWNEISVKEAARLMPLVYKNQKREVHEDHKGEFIITHQLHNHNQDFNEKTRKDLVFVIHYNPKSQQVKFSEVGKQENHDGFVAIQPRRIAGYENRFYAWRWSREKIRDQLDDLYFIEHKDSFCVYTKRRNFEFTSLRDMITNVRGGIRDIKKMKIGFPNPKPINLIKLLIQTVTCKNDIVLDSFAGSGTTAHAVLQLNKEDGGNRQFVLVEMDKEISENVTAKRIQKAINGYKYRDSEKKESKICAPLEGGFRFCTLGVPLFAPDGGIHQTVTFSDLAAHIFFSETGKPIPKSPENTLLGEDEGRAIYLLYNDTMGNINSDGGNMLTSQALKQLPEPSAKMTRVIFAEGNLLSDDCLEREDVKFCQVPYHIKTW